MELNKILVNKFFKLIKICIKNLNNSQNFICKKIKKNKN